MQEGGPAAPQPCPAPLGPQETPEVPGVGVDPNPVCCRMRMEIPLLSPHTRDGDFKGLSFSSLFSQKEEGGLCLGEGGWGGVRGAQGA